jgi:hypothetical protein
MLILSFILIALGRSLPKLPPEVCRLLLETGRDNIEALIEELGIKSKAIYLPSSLTGDQPRAFIPLRSNPEKPVINHALPRRLIVRYGAHPEDMGLLVSTIGSMAIKMIDQLPGANSLEIEPALTALLAGKLGIAESVLVTENGKTINIEISKPDIKYDAGWSSRCLGGPLASIAASVVAEAWNQPVMITQEETAKDKHLLQIEVNG